MDYKEICEKLDDYWYQCPKEMNKVVCAKEFISHNFKDRELLLQLKAQTLDEDFGYGLSLLLAEIGSAFSVTGVLFSIVNALDDSIAKIKTIEYALLDVGVILIFLSLIVIFTCRFRKVRKWRNYILVAIEEILK